MKPILAFVLFALTGTVWSQVVDIAGTSAGGSSRESLRVPINGVVAISLPSGQRAVIQFTRLTDTAADYRWKYRANSGAEIQTGAGKVIEKYEEMAPRDGDGHEVLPLPGHDIIVRAGEIRAEWSAGGTEYCYLYFNPKRAKAALVGLDAFNKDP